MTLKDIAECAGVSVGTVSKAFADSKEVSSSTKTKIFAIAKENNCYDKYSLRNFSKKIISIIIPSMNEYCNAAEVLEKAIQSNNGLPVILISNNDRKTERQLLDFSVKYKKADGVVIINPINKAENERVVAVSIDTSDYIASLDEAIVLLKHGGHTKISFICSASGKFNSDIFKDTLARNGIRSGFNYYVESDTSAELSGYESMEYLFGMPSVPTAVIAESDLMAKGAEKYITKRGFKVPKDISVVSLDSLASESSVNAECKTAVKMLFNKLGNLDKKRK